MMPLQTNAKIPDPLTFEERQQLAHLSESVAAYEFFRDVDVPITQQEARRIAFVSWLVFQRKLSEYPEWEQRPRRFVSSDPRRCFQP